MKKDIPGYEGLYAVDEQGTVWSLRGIRPRRLTPQVSTGGYLKVMLYRGGVKKWNYLHRLVAEAFIPKSPGCDVVNHIDANPQNNCVLNLEWVSQSENIAYSRKLGNQNKDKPVIITSPRGQNFRFGNMRDASRFLFGGPYILRGQHRRRGNKFTYHGYTVEVEKEGGAQ